MNVRKTRALYACAAVLAALAISGCASETTTSTSGSTGGEPGKYDQTWSKQYSDTTCDDWTGEMDDHQQWVAAADMLSGARSADGEDGLPSDSMITEFQGGITTACVVPTMAFNEVAAGLYVTEPRFRP